MTPAVTMGLIAALGTITIQEQPETLIRGPVESGGFGGPVVKFTELADQFAVFVGGRGGWIINHCFIIGGGGYGLVNEDVEIHPSVMDSDPECVLEMGYGGLELEYVHRSKRVVHGSIMVLIGGGSAGYHDWYWDSTIDSDAFFIAEPTLNFELNVSRPFRIAFGGGYRFVSGFELPELPEIDDSDLGGITGTLTFKFGSF